MTNKSKPKPVTLADVKRKQVTLADVKYEDQRLIRIPNAVRPPYNYWEKYQANRYTVRSDGYGVFGIWDKQKDCWADGSGGGRGSPADYQFSNRAAAWKYLRTTTEQEYKLWRLNQALDRGTA